jgi:hypothetical protein
VVHRSIVLEVHRLPTASSCLSYKSSKRLDAQLWGTLNRSVHHTKQIFGCATRTGKSGLELDAAPLRNASTCVDFVNGFLTESTSDIDLLQDTSKALNQKRRKYRIPLKIGVCHARTSGHLKHLCSVSFHIGKSSWIFQRAAFGGLLGPSATSRTSHACCYRLRVPQSCSEGIFFLCGYWSPEALGTSEVP